MRAVAARPPTSDQTGSSWRGCTPNAVTLLRMARSLESAVVLNTMLDLLQRTPRCASPLQAWALIRDVVTQASTNVPGVAEPWTLNPPSLIGGYWSRSPCGTWRARLVSHLLYINPNGAYCILDAKAGEWPLFEQAASCGTRFEMPGAAVKLDAWV